MRSQVACYPHRLAYGVQYRESAHLVLLLCFTSADGFARHDRGRSFGSLKFHTVQHCVSRPHAPRQLLRLGRSERVVEDRLAQQAKQ